MRLLQHRLKSTAMQTDGRYFSDRYKRQESNATIGRVSRHIVDGDMQRAIFGKYCIIVLCKHIQCRGYWLLWDREWDREWD